FTNMNSMRNLIITPKFFVKRKTEAWLGGSSSEYSKAWWIKFRIFRVDNRIEEFYTLPYNLNGFFPPILLVKA
ncbi:predicted protein, partial [Arabidopsis lyrata subsp. lyrata]